MNILSSLKGMEVQNAAMDTKLLISAKSFNLKRPSTAIRGPKPEKPQQDLEVDD